MNTAYSTLLSAFYTRRFLWVLAILFTLAWFGVLDYRHLVASDEGRYGEIAREMYATGDWVTPRYNGYKYFEKPPLQAWMTAIAYTLFGVGEWQSRLWTGITGYFAILATGFTAWKLVGGERGVLAGWVSAILLASSPMWNVGGHFNTLDMGLSSILSCALFALLLAQRAGLSVTARRNWMWLCWAFMALAVLSKGLIGLVIPGMVLVVYTLTTWDWGLWKRLHLFSGLVVFFLIATPWFVLVSLKNPEFPHFFFIHEHWDRFTKDGHNRKGHPLYAVLHEGRHLESATGEVGTVSALIATHRPANLPADLPALCDSVYLGRLAGYSDADRCYREGWVPEADGPRAARAILGARRPGEFSRWP